MIDEVDFCRSAMSDGLELDRLGLGQRVLDQLDFVGRLFEHQAGDDLAAIELEDIRLILFVDPRRRLEQLLQDIERLASWGRASPGRARRRCPTPSILWQADAIGHLKDLLAVAVRAALPSASPIAAGQIVELPLGARPAILQ